MFQVAHTSMQNEGLSNHRYFSMYGLTTVIHHFTLLTTKHMMWTHAIVLGHTSSHNLLHLAYW